MEFYLKNNRLIKYKLMAVILVFLLFVPLLPITAQDGPPSIGQSLKDAGAAAQYEEVTEGKAIFVFAGLVGKVIGLLFAVLGIIFLILVIHGGYLWMTAHGNEERVTEARKQIRMAIIGVIILVGAYAIANFVLSALSAYNKALQGF